MLQRSWALFFIAIFSFNSFGYYFVYKAGQLAVKREVQLRIKNALPEEELIALSFQRNSAEFKRINWVEDHEFIYGDHFYDIVRSEETPGETITFYCIDDAREEVLFADLDRHIRQETGAGTADEENDDPKKKLAETVKDYFFTSTAFAYIRTAQVLYFRANSFAAKNRETEITTPPPDQA